MNIACDFELKEPAAVILDFASKAIMPLKPQVTVKSRLFGRL